MDTNYVEIALVLDRSGSMSIIAPEVQTGLARFIDTQKSLPGKCLLTLVQFDDPYNIETVYEGRSITDIYSIPLVPRGGTALLDAIGKTITLLGERLSSMEVAERPSKVIFVVVTDGEENSSKEFKRDQVFSMISHQREAYSWEFVFLAANQDAIQTGQSLGFLPRSSMTFAAVPDGASYMCQSLSHGITRARYGLGQVEFTSHDREVQNHLLRTTNDSSTDSNG